MRYKIYISYDKLILYNVEIYDIINTIMIYESVLT